MKRLDKAILDGSAKSAFPSRSVERRIKLQCQHANFERGDCFDFCPDCGAVRAKHTPPGPWHRREVRGIKLQCQHANFERGDCFDFCPDCGAVRAKHTPPGPWHRREVRER